MLGLAEHYQPNLPDLLLPELIRPISRFSILHIVPLLDQALIPIKTQAARNFLGATETG
jgi:hypothetical protein